MKFKTNQVVLYGRTRYENGDDVPVELAHFFAVNGWIDPADDEATSFISSLRGDAPKQKVVLAVDPANIIHGIPEVASNG